MVHEIMRIAHEYGEVSIFRAYLDLKILSLSGDARFQLHCAGVSLRDCPHNGRKEVVDHTLVGTRLGTFFQNRS